MQRTCRNQWCGQTFEVTDEDLEFYKHASPEFGGKKYPIPPPTKCPTCRQQQRLFFKNFSHMYRRSCSKTGKSIVSMYNKEASFPVYELATWWSDDWSPLEFGIPMDTERSFFWQFGDLCSSVPRPSNVISQSENSDYCNYCFETRNSYLVSGCVRNEDCCYGHIVWNCKSCFDGLYCYRSELCYECVSCTDCYMVVYAKDAENCSQCAFIDDCIGCKSCFGCIGLRNKEYHIFNEPKTKEQYLDFLGNQTMTNAAILQKMEKLRSSHIVKATHLIASENASGDYLINCKNIHLSFDLKNCEDCAYCATLDNFKDAADCDYAAIKTEVAYNSLTCYGYGMLCSSNCMSVGANLVYCESCFSCKHCFGCLCLRNNTFCILNTQYTEDEYQRLVPKIIEKMMADGEWGEFFPASVSPFGYNETVAYEYFPHSKQKMQERGWRWSEYEAAPPQAEKILKAKGVPDSIDDVPDDILHWAVECEATKHPFKIIKQELAFYRNMRLPIPRVHPDERHRRRMALRNPRKLWDRECMKCRKPIATSFAPERPEIVYCEECYLKEVY